MEEREVQFNHVFEQWASEYDRTVVDTNGEYAEVFEGYEQILREVAQELKLPAKSKILEIGVGTGNLTRLLLSEGWRVFGIDPSPDMRSIASRKLPDFTIEDGHFLSVPESIGRVDGIVSTYAFHHLTDEQKMRAIQQLVDRLNENGMVVFADTAYADEKAKQAIHEKVKEQKAFALLEDLRTEYYPLVSTMKHIFQEAGLDFFARPLNKYVWLFVGKKVAR
ncbi:class I SAM-dependent methyltransferase [Aneurinibacillus aneurinilyticus]|uniref:Class I SAM-dependent methyltransferase n=1 Tax=Aneurinibacillus aneurinilyticus TaxID=1391 RepID=A0A848D438_ANEAE|nr:class I SAM-dependent methyltransferase [Aneurinibacillus aneurinilyticus]MED0672139.1 methyltransferase domain-containing protein [Aneurinibacillus aneurinilyticus]NMF00451.1 class I SAM-dependent methyltransferase [Aneurinibacillus aneurinilyticus]